MTPRSLAALAALLLASTAAASAEPVFNRIASFPVTANKPEGADLASPSSAEIVAASADGMTLAYSDSPAGGVGFIDIADPRAPKAGGFVAFEGGEPTSVAFAGETLLVGVNTSESFVSPSGQLAAVNVSTKAVSATCELGGQPDSVAVAPDGSFAAVAIENERDEEVNDGALPQMPAGFLAVLPLSNGAPDCGAIKRVELTGLSGDTPEDPEPEFVDVNADGEIVVTLQENNAIAIVDGKTGAVTAHFSAGAVALENVDTQEDGRIAFTDQIEARPREPDAVKWLGTDRLVIANEGDWKGGTRGFTILTREGTVAWESGPAFEMELARAGHYPEGRSDAKGVEPEGLAVAEFGEERLIFVLFERGSAVGVYRDAAGAAPEFLQLLPSGISPEGAVAISERNLLATANEADLGEDGGARSHVMLYERAEGAAAYPQLVSLDAQNGRPIPWGAISGLSADPAGAEKLFAVSDSVYSAAPTIYAIDASSTPARITRAIPVTRNGAAAEKLDMEGIAADADGTFWIGSEGDPEKEVPHAILHVGADGAILEEIPFPEALTAGQTRFGTEGVAKIGDTLWLAIQRNWKDDPKSAAKLVSYDLETKEWGAVLYPLDAPKGEGWVGLSEMAVKGDHAFFVERDNQIGDKAAIKQITRVALAELQPAPLGGELPTVEKEVVHDLLPELASLTSGYVVDKVEGFAFDAAGTAFVATDNDGVDDSSGETLFFRLPGL
ncbi:esterase-like activity of phytase family protein [Antarcticirhabdus aurantiaca]|uniref:Esterase-like activity of phytase family protein n=1 Tax=Antarcticirhabdus aurantiaca TaxID=2606717 RepID=A0ACD4NJS5_9HYPH|nr:esterase-like activity of phytase family protein [Antarcticirhabdus aurantiaca]WAJ27074.1 esterase-like activity of phytase family protein [Jeongeuplla avenae]